MYCTQWDLFCCTSDKNKVSNSLLQVGNKFVLHQIILAHCCDRLPCISMMSNFNEVKIKNKNTVLKFDAINKKSIEIADNFYCQA